MLLPYTHQRDTGMACIACNFCTHDNPEGSKFCNACGSPLNLTQCSHCEAINSVYAEQCFQCGAPLSQPTTGEMATPPVALTETAQSAESAPAKGDRVPVAVAECLEALPGHPHVVSDDVSHEPEATGEDQPSLAAALIADPASHDDDGALSLPDAGHATHSGRNANRARGFLVVVFVAVAGAAAYWISVNPTQPPDPRTAMDGARTAAPEPAPNAPADPPQSAASPTGSPTADSLPAGALLPSSGGSSQSPATVGESISPSAEAGQSTAGASKSPVTISPGADVEPPAAGQAPESVGARVPIPSEAAESLDGGTAKTAKARATNDSGRTLTRGRTREQAERDADATRRLVARDLADSPPYSDDRPLPRP